MPRDVLLEMYDEGGRAARGGSRIEENPYSVPEMRAEWERGFEAELDAMSWPFQAVGFAAIVGMMLMILRYM